MSRTTREYNEPSDSGDDEEQFYADLMLAARRHSTATVLFHHAIAETIGLSATDHKYLDILVQEGAIPAGRLAEITGLTSGAVTGVVDRLEEAGLVRREKDPSDRRKVIIRPLPSEGMRKIGPAFEAFAFRVRELYGGYERQELATILEYLNQATAMLREATREIQK